MKIYRINIFWGAIISLLAFSLAAAPVQGAARLMYSPTDMEPGKSIKGGKFVSSGKETGWQATLDSRAEARQQFHQAIDIPTVSVDPVNGTVDILIERVLPEGERSVAEAILAFG